MAAVLSFSQQVLIRVSRPIACSRMFSTSQGLQAGEKWRISKGQAPDGIRYGPLTDQPDWSYADGRPAPQTARRRRRMQSRLDVAQRISQLLSEVDEVKDKTETSTKTTV